MFHHSLGNAKGTRTGKATVDRMDFVLQAYAKPRLWKCNSLTQSDVPAVSEAATLPHVPDINEILQ
jgi:hypothetical protein